MIELLIVDSSVIADSSSSQLVNLEEICAKFTHSGVKLALVATNQQRLKLALKRQARISFHESITGEEIHGRAQNSFKGGPDRITEVCKALGVAPYRTLYIGDEHSDYTSSLHAGAFYIHCDWVKANNTPCVHAEHPYGIWRFATHYLLHPPRWTFTLDSIVDHFHLRCLLRANTGQHARNGVSLVCNAPRRTFKLKPLLKDKLEVYCGKYNATQILAFHALCSLRLEGLCPPYSVFTVYPSSDPANTNPVVSRVAHAISLAAGTFFRDDLLIRAHRVSPSHVEKSANRDSFTLQTNSVYLNADRKAIISGKTVVVFDDFHTTGKSLEWARKLLLAGGAAQVVLVAIGKFGGDNKPHERYDLKTANAVMPFAVNNYLETDFQVVLMRLSADNNGEQIVSQSFQSLLNDQAYGE